MLTQRNRAGRRDLGRARCWQLPIGWRDRDLRVPWRRLGSPCQSEPWMSWMMEPRKAGVLINDDIVNIWNRAAGLLQRGQKLRRV